MNDAASLWEQVQSRFKNSWFGITILALIALAVFLSQVGDSVKKLMDWMPPPAADLTIERMPIDPLPEYRQLVKAAGPDTVYPGGAMISFGLRHDRGGEEEITIKSLDVRVDAYEPQGACPYTLTGDNIFGAGERLPREFTVWMSRGKVEEVRRKAQLNGPIMRGRSNNLMDTEPPLRLFVKKTGDETEEFVIRFIQDDPGRYRIGLSTRYTDRNELKSAYIASVAFCRPAD
jgi:hypothetical protein